jgi:DNA-binding MarR family transcriptional regulator
MLQSFEEDVTLVSESMSQFVQAMSRPRFWERRVVVPAGVSIDRAGASLLHMLEQSSVSGYHLRDLAMALGIEAPSVTRKVQQLERAGLVERVADPNDGRAFVVKTTSAGRHVLTRLHKAKRELFAEALREWPAADRQSFAKLFHRLAVDVERINPH